MLTKEVLIDYIKQLKVKHRVHTKTEVEFGGEILKDTQRKGTCDTVTFSIFAQRLISNEQNQKQLSLTSFNGRKCSKSTTVQVNLQEILLHSSVILTQTGFNAHSHIFLHC